MFLQSLWELHALFSEGVYKPLISPIYYPHNAPFHRSAYSSDCVQHLGLLFLDRQFTLITFTATTRDADFSLTSMTLTFASGSAGGSEMCASITVVSDYIVESDENFTVELSLLTLAGTSLRLGNTETTVTIVDSDGMVVNSRPANQY